MIRRLVVLGAFACALASPALAHPGHGAPEFASSWLHYVSEPGHVLAVVALGITAGGVLLARRRAPER